MNFFYQTIGKNIAKNKLEEENDLQCKLTKAEFELQNCLDDLVFLNELTFIKHQLGSLHRCKIQGKRIRARMNWLKDGDAGSKYFFNIIWAKHKVEKIENTQVEGSKTNDPKVIKDAFYSFYLDLFSSDFD